MAKIVMSRLPPGHAFWQRLGLFRHGSMDKADYALEVFKCHANRACFANQMTGKTILELGPGDSVASAVIAYSYGAQAILVDAGSFAIEDFTPYIALSELLRLQGLRPIDLSGLNSLTELLDVCHAKYLVNGLEGLRRIPDQSVDFIFSHAVLEHVRKADFIDTMRECARILKPTGVCSHQVDLRDHLGGRLNNLRFSEQTWESDYFARSGFYTNRIRFEEMVDIFWQVGFVVEVIDIRRWDSVPIKRRHLAPEFRKLRDSDLIVSGFDVLLRREASEKGTNA